MQAAAWAKVTDLVSRALDVPAPDRSAWVQAETAGDPEITTEVLRLLAAEAEAGGFLEAPLLAEPAAAAAVHAALPADDGLSEGARLGPYRILRRIGQGGMGTVYLAARADEVFEKAVAIKVATANGAHVRELFSRERKVLAALDHPGIARVLDGGDTLTGQPYFVMQYVEGVPIDVYCDTHRLDLRARLRLVVDVCAAVHYAHDRLVVHRDIKPSNVLVGEDGHPTLLDFGIAKLLDAVDPFAGSSRTLAHAWTPESASPEQVRGEPTSVATDVYGLGALLYRLFTGGPVFDLSGADRMTRERIICETVPRPPSRARADSRTGLQAVPTDVDLIVLKALHKDPTRRYRSVGHLAEDVERYLVGRPVLAAPESWRYRAGKFVGRHPAATAATAAAVVAILGASGTAMVQARRADAERDRARARLADVRRLASTLIFDVYDKVENSPNATTIRKSLVEQGLGHLDGFAADAAADQALSLELAEAYRRLADVQGGGNANLGDREGARRSLSKSRALLEPFLRGPDAPMAVEIADLNLRRELSRLDEDRSRRRTAVADAVARAERLVERLPGRFEPLETLARLTFEGASAAADGEQLSLWVDANRRYTQLVELRPNDADLLRGLALTEKYLGAAHSSSGDQGQARAHYDRALALDRKVQTVRPASRQTTIDLAIDLGNIAYTLWQGETPKHAEAAAMFRESLTYRERAVAMDPQDVFAQSSLAFCLTQLASLSAEMKEIDAATTYARRAVEIVEQTPERSPFRRGIAWNVLGATARAQGRATEACRAFRAASTHLTAAVAASDGPAAIRDRDVGLVSKALASCPP